MKQICKEMGISAFFFAKNLVNPYFFHDERIKIKSVLTNKNEESIMNVSNDKVHGQMTTQRKQKGKGISYEDKSSQTLWGIRFKIRRI